MSDINYQLRVSYKTLLSTITYAGNPVPVYYAQLPTGNNDNLYILINIITSTGFKDDCNNMQNTTVQLMVVEKADQNNSGFACDDVAGQVKSIIMPSPRAAIVTVDDGQVIGTDLTLDVVNTGLTDGQKKVINRIINFQHPILLNNVA